MHLRIVRPLPSRLEGFDVTRFQLLGAYDVQAPLSDILIVSGYAVPIDPPTPSRGTALKAIADAVVSKPANLRDHLDRPITRSRKRPQS